MKNLLIILTLFISSISFAQNISIDEVDKFTENRVIQINALTGKYWSASDAINKNVFKEQVFLSTKLIKSPEGNITSYINLNVQSSYSLCFSQGQVIFLFENGEKLILNQSSKLDCNTKNNVQFLFTVEELKILSNNIISEFRMYTTDGYIDFEMKKKAKKIVQETFKWTFDKLKKIQQ
ncbi:hypothetical protein [Myroides odoratus]|uniref:hypothetical protein n=1 Tax=Myroides odoratus TaxID=256 RepID=UPI00333E6E7A